MKRIVPLVLAIVGVLVIYRGLTGELPSDPQSAYAWGGVLAFGFAIVLVLIGTLAVWQGHMGLGWRAGLIVAALAVGGTYGGMRLRASAAPRVDCDAAIDHMRKLFVAGDPGGATVKRLDNRRAMMKKRCESAPSLADRQCILAATSIAQLQRCTRW